MTQPEAVTKGIRVRIASEFSPQHSDPERHRWFFAYTIRISNEGSEVVKLLNRSWIITNAAGEIEHVRGPGVVGEQPVLLPGHAFEYTSGCPLGTPFGSMRGSYEMANERGEHFDVEIPAFVLRLPGSMN